MWIFDRIHTLLRGNALLAGLLCGGIGLLIDLDHIVAYYASWQSSAGSEIIRPLHTPILIAAGIVLIFCCAYLGGLYIKLVLRRL